MTPQTTDPRAQREAGRTGGNTGHPNHTTHAPVFNGDGFRCAWCGEWHPWSAVELFDGPRRWCPTCGDAFERIVNPPVYYAGDRR